MSDPICILDGCEKPSRSKSGTAMCKMHYHRQYRHGAVDKVATRKRTRPDAGEYQQRMAWGHPVAGPSGKAYIHRIVLFDLIGPGWHPCYWCDKQVSWDLPARTDSLGLQVDHLNSRRDDNRPENLVPSCRDCNAGRGAQARHDALVAEGFWSENDTVAKLRNQRRVPRVGSRTQRISPAA